MSEEAWLRSALAASPGIPAILEPPPISRIATDEYPLPDWLNEAQDAMDSTAKAAQTAEADLLHATAVAAAAENEVAKARAALIAERKAAAAANIWVRAGASATIRAKTDQLAEAEDSLGKLKRLRSST